MISKERLEELIKEGATIWAMGRYSFQDKIEEIKLDEDFFSVNNNALIYPDLFYTKLEDLFETKEQAEWALKYHATRTEELNLPMWKDVNKTFMGREGDFRIIDKYNIELIYWKFKECSIEVRYKKDGETIEQKIFEPATEENYIKACDLCLKLFKGEENEN